MIGLVPSLNHSLFFVEVPRELLFHTNPKR